jgi:gamma-glutamyl hercynylcysteine S-oxide synthase
MTIVDRSGVAGDRTMGSRGDDLRARNRDDLRARSRVGNKAGDGTRLTATIVHELDVARARTRAVLAPLDDDALRRQHSPLMSPLIWDLAHIGNYEDQWLVRALGGVGVGVEHDDIYDAFRHPRRDRPALPMLGPDAAARYLDAVRERALDLLASTSFGSDDANPLTTNGSVYGMVIQHEHQHVETMLATLQLMAAPGYRPILPTHGWSAAPRGVSPGTCAAEVLVPAGPFVLGTDDEPWAYDNERGAHGVDLPDFFIDTTPVTNGAYLEFVEAGGYHDPRWWTPDGWAWRQEADLRHPQFWGGIDDGGTPQRPRAGRSAAPVTRNRFGFIEDLPLDQPVQHVCWYEADAYARWTGKRLPTEAEWEKAASWDPVTSTKRRFPWGDDPPEARHANLVLDGRHTFGPAPVHSFPDGASPYGCQQMVGDVWEWTASDFVPWPGFRAFPYREYSEVFWGNEYKVLKGGSWAVHPSAIRTTFRNWDYPIRRQIFAGFRCARDARV